MKNSKKVLTKEFNMEIPTKEIIEQLEILLPPHRRDAIQLIKAQALEIRELQAGICRLREEMQKMEKITWPASEPW